MGHLSSYYVDFIMDDISLQALANIQGKLGYTLSVTDYINIPIVPIVLGSHRTYYKSHYCCGTLCRASATGRVQLQLFSLTGKANFFEWV